jgi:Flp pilus assembly protein CpaB
VLVLKAPSSSNSSNNNNNQQAVILRLTDTQAARMAYAADNGKVWFALRPPTGDVSGRPSTVTEQSVAGPQVNALPGTTP